MRVAAKLFSGHLRGAGGHCSRTSHLLARAGAQTASMHLNWQGEGWSGQEAQREESLLGGRRGERVFQTEQGVPEPVASLGDPAPDGQDRGRLNALGAVDASFTGLAAQGLTWRVPHVCSTRT